MKSCLNLGLGAVHGGKGGEGRKRENSERVITESASKILHIVDKNFPGAD